METKSTGLNINDNDQDEYDQQQLQCKYLVEQARARPDIWKIRTVHNGQKHFIQIKNDGMIWIIDEVNGKYELNVLMKESIEAIIDMQSG